MSTNEGVAIPGEGQVASLNPELHAQAVAEKARSKGWKPLEEYTGEAADWVDAKEFLGRERLFNTIHDQRREIKKLEKDISAISKHFENMEKAAYTRALNELKAKQAVAVEEQDVSAVKETTEQIAELTKQHAEQKQSQTQQGESPEFVQWRQDNEWFEKDSEMREDAIAIGVGYAAKNLDKSQEEVLRYVTEKVKKIYPEKFKKPVRKEPVVESGNGTGSEAQPATKKSKGLTVGDLDEREVATMKTFIKRGVFKEQAKKLNISEQEVYLRDLAKAKGVA